MRPQQLSLAKRPFVPNIFKLKRNKKCFKNKKCPNQASSRLKQLGNNERANAKALKTLKQETNTPSFL